MTLQKTQKLSKGAGTAAVENDIFLKSYEAVRCEMMERLRLRDQLLVAYLAFFGVFCGGIFIKTGPPLSGTVSSLDKLFAFPVFAIISIGISLMICRHEIILSKLSKFNVEELGPFFEKYTPVPQWDGNPGLDKFGEKRYSRFLAYMAVLVGPPSICAVFVLGSFKKMITLPFGPLLFILSVISPLVCLLIIGFGNWIRQKI